MLRSQLGDLIVMMGNEKDYLATRTAYKLNLQRTGAEHLHRLLHVARGARRGGVRAARGSLRDGDCRRGLDDVSAEPRLLLRGRWHHVGRRALSPVRCRMPSGTVFSNGIAAVILKPLDRAIDDGDTIHAVVRGVGLNNDGSDKVSFTAPSVAGQAGAIREACEQAGVVAGIDRLRRSARHCDGARRPDRVRSVDGSVP